MKAVTINNLVIQYDEAVYSQNFDNTVGGTNPGEIKRISDGVVFVRFYDNGVTLFESGLSAIAASAAAFGNMTKIQLP